MPREVEFRVHTERLFGYALVNIFKSIEGIFDILCPSGDMAELLNLQGKLEPLTLKHDLINCGFFMTIRHSENKYIM